MAHLQIFFVRQWSIYTVQHPSTFSCITTHLWNVASVKKDTPSWTSKSAAKHTLQNGACWWNQTRLIRVASWAPRPPPIWSNCQFKQSENCHCHIFFIYLGSSISAGNAKGLPHSSLGWKSLIVFIFRKGVVMCTKVSPKLFLSHIQKPTHPPSSQNQRKNYFINYTTPLSNSLMLHWPTSFPTLETSPFLFCFVKPSLPSLQHKMCIFFLPIISWP